MKILIVYSSQSGNTLKLAKALFDNLDEKKEIFSVEDAPSPDNYDLAAVGFWLQAGKPDPKIAEYLAKCGKESRLFLFATHGAAKGSDHADNALNHAVSLTDGAEIAGVFSCQGEVNPKFLEKVKQKEQPPIWINDASTAVGHPDESDIKELVNSLKKHC